MTKNMKISRKLSCVLAAVVGMTVAGAVNAQYRVGNDGRALDANNRIGSGGVNDAGSTGSRMPYGQLGNNIVTGTVTGGREFRGSVPYSDPTAFRGATAGGLSDRFIRSSAGVPQAGGPSQNNAQNVQPFYGAAQTVTPPPGFAPQSQLPSTGAGFVPAPAMTRQPGDLRMGQVLGTQTATLPPPGQLIMPGPVDPNTQTNTVITASPLYGVRQWTFGAEADQEFLANTLGATGSTRLNIDPATLRQMREELLQPGQQDQSLPGAVDQTGQPTQQGQQPLNSATQTPFDAPQNLSLSNNSAIQSSQALGNSAMSANLSTNAGLQRRQLLSAREQSTQYAALQERLKQYQSIQQSDQARASMEAQREWQRAKAAQQGTPTPQPGAEGNVAQPGTAQPGMGQPGVAQPGAGQPGISMPGNVTQQPQPGVGTAPGGTTPIPTPPPVAQQPPRDRPLQVKSLAEGVSAKGLADVLKEAENLMRNERYNSALEQFTLAEQIAPNNPLIMLGRANAELGQSYYNRAEQHLRQAFMQDQALLMGQYDLHNWLGQERLEFLVRDLKEIARRETREARPVFLLAYIAYNTGNERNAAAYLDLAEKRSPNDQLFALVRKHWNLPKEAAPQGDLNK